MDKIVIFTVNSSGGIAQYAARMAEAAVNNGCKVIMMVPSDFAYTFHFKGNKDIEVDFYEKFRPVGVLGRQRAMKLAEIIEAHSPDLVIYPNNVALSMHVASQLNEGTLQAMVVHDVDPYLTYFNLKKTLKTKYEQRLFMKTLKHVDCLVLPSRSSYNRSMVKYPVFSGKRVVLPLCAHLILNDHEEEELRFGSVPEGDYLLFVGRVDRYKGIEYLLKAYEKDEEGILPQLVIAGTGVMSEAEKKLCEKLVDRITRFDAFVRDHEIAALVEGAYAVILPHIQTSQSGLLPIAYQYGKPVVASSAYGLMEFVEDGQTGFVFNTQDADDLYRRLKDLCSDPERYAGMCENALSFSWRRLNWERNMKMFLNEVEKI